MAAARIASGKRLIIGSHIDTVPDAGAFDGVLGVVLALEWVEIAQELDLPLAIEVIAFSEEEGVRFGVPFIGSRAVAGRFDPALLALKDADGVTLEDAIRAFGLDPEQIEQAALDDDALGFVEMHIEQGPVLEAEDLSVAAVTGIVGQIAAHSRVRRATPIMPAPRPCICATMRWPAPPSGSSRWNR